MSCYFDVYSPCIAEYEDEDISNIHLTAEESPWDPLTNENSEEETHMLYHQGKISIPARAARDQYLSAQLSHTHWLSMPLMLQIMIILQLHRHLDSYQCSAESHVQKTVSRANSFG